MLSRKILWYFKRSHCGFAFLQTFRTHIQQRHLSYSLGLPTNSFSSENSNFLPVSSLFNQFHVRYSLAVEQNRVESLCQNFLSESERNYESERAKELIKVISFLLSNGYSSKDIREKFSDYLKSNTLTYSKITILADIDRNVAMLLPLASLPESVLKIIACKLVSDKPYIKGFLNRILYLAHHFEIEPSELVTALAKHPKLLTMKFPRLDSKMKILKDAHIDSEYIVKDLWIFNYTEQLLGSRIQAALKAGVDLKPWMLRCSAKFFSSILVKYSETQRILNGDSVHTYLAKRLDCRPDYINYLMERNKLLKFINVPKLDQVNNYFILLYLAL